MTWFKSLIMRQNSPLLLIDSNSSYRSVSKRRRVPLANSSISRLEENENNIAQIAENERQEVRFSNCDNSCSNIDQDHQAPITPNPRANPTVNATTTTTTSTTATSISQPQLVLQSTTLSTNLNGSDLTARGERSTKKASHSGDKGSCQNHSGKIAQDNQASSYRQLRCRESSVMIRLSQSPIVGLVLVAGLMLLQLAAGASQSQQHFEAHPEAQYLTTVGHDVRIRCLIRYRQGECLWLRNGRGVGVIKNKYQYVKSPEDGDCSIMIRNVSVVLDDGQWQCQVTSSDVEQDNALQSREVKLVVLVAPERPQIKNMTTQTSQQQQPRLILEENKSKAIVCEIRGGNPAPQIEWILDGKSITKESNQSSVLPANAAANQRITQSRLKMNDIKRTMNGKNLTCVGVHQTINQSTSVELDVQYVPTVSVIQREYSIVEGSPLTISCQVDSNPPPSHVNWRLVSDGKQSSQTSISQPSKPGPVLEFDRIGREFNQNIFECLAQNTYGVSLPADVKLNVLYAPFLLNTSHSQHVLVGSNASLTCLFEGNPEPEIRWHYTDPLSRSAVAIPLDGSKQQHHLNITNVTYRNEGDYHCEAHNQINGVNYGSRSSSMMLDVYGEPQFLAKSPVHAKVVQGSKSDISLTFCSDPVPNKVVWQFGSLKLEPGLPNINNGQQQLHPAALTSSQALPGAGSKQNSIYRRFYPHPLQAIQKRASNFSRDPTCFEATLTLLDPELTDQRDYTLMVQNERGFQTGTVRLRITSPLSPAIMITSAFLTICALFLCSLLVMFVLKKRSQLSGSSTSSNHTNSTTTTNGTTNGSNGNNNSLKGSKLKNGERLVNGNGAAIIQANGKQQQTRGIVNGAGNGLANGASNPMNSSAQNSLVVASDDYQKQHLMSMASSDTSGDQKQLLATSSSDRTNSSADASPTQMHHSNGTANNRPLHHHHHNDGFAISSSTGSRSTANSTPTSTMNHISVEEEIQLGHRSVADGGSSSYQAGESVNCDEPATVTPTSIYANLEYGHNNSNQMQSPQHQQLMHQRRYHTPTPQMDLAVDHTQLVVPSVVTAAAAIDVPETSPSFRRTNDSPKGAGLRSSVGATIAMMNSLAAAAAASNGPMISSPGAGVLNGAINQQIAANQNRGSQHVIRKPGPPKPPKPSIQQRSRFYQQHQQIGNGNSSALQNSTNGGLVMIGSQMSTGQEDTKQTGSDLAAEYSRIAFSARAEL